MFYALDRFEEEWAVLQDDHRQECLVPRSDLLPQARVGDVFTREENRFVFAPAETDRRRQEIQAYQERLRRPQKGESE